MTTNTNPVTPAPAEALRLRKESLELPADPVAPALAPEPRVLVDVDPSFGRLRVTHDGTHYAVEVGGVVRHPKSAAEDVIRALGHYLHGAVKPAAPVAQAAVGVSELRAALQECIQAMDVARDTIQPITVAQMKLDGLNPDTANILDAAAAEALAALSPHPEADADSATPAPAEPSDEEIAEACFNIWLSNYESLGDYDLAIARAVLALKGTTK